MLRKCLYIIPLIFALLGSGEHCTAQILPVNNQYFVNPYSLSPAFAGYNNKSELFTGFRKQWAGMTGAPTTSLASLTVPMRSNVWLGGMIMSDQSSIFNNFYMHASYTYKLRLAEKHILRFGIWATILQNSINLRNINIADQNDPLLENKEQLVNTGVNAGVGFLYQNGKFIFGITLPNLFVNRSTYTLGSETNPMLIERNLIMYGLYLHPLNENWKLKSSIVLRSTKSTPNSVDILALGEYKNILWCGIFYRSGTILGGTVGGYIIDNITLNYSYEFSNNGFTQYTSGTHEFTIGFDLGLGRKHTGGGKGMYPMIINYNSKYRK